MGDPEKIDKTTEKSRVTLKTIPESHETGQIYV